MNIGMLQYKTIFNGFDNKGVCVFTLVCNFY
jgi:hypothetical protein